MLRSRNLAGFACLLVLAFTAGGSDRASGQDGSAAAKALAPAQDEIQDLPQEEAIPRLELKLPGPETIKPSVATGIPDTPPPHEGALFEDPYTIEPPDVLNVEALQALPGRPISGQYMVRRDGAINLGWYGEVHVRGLTLTEAKVKILLQIRKFIADEALGLVVMDPNNRKLLAVPPAESTEVFVDVAGFYSAHFYMNGDVAVTGKLNITGAETIADAIATAGGFLPSADAKNIILYRPGRAGMPPKEYPIDYESIIKGNPKANLQVFKGDRIVVGRDKIVEETLMVDRASENRMSYMNSLLSFEQLLNSQKSLLGWLNSQGLSEDAKRAKFNRMLDLWRQDMLENRGVRFNPSELRDHLLELVQPQKAEVKTN